MRKVPAYAADDGKLFENAVECARHDVVLAIHRMRAAFFSFDPSALDVPRGDLRRHLNALERAVKVAQQCLKDLDHYDEDPTDPEQIRQAHNKAQREALDKAKQEGIDV